jgi:hypothetical protein
LEKLACGRFSDIAAFLPAKGAAFASCVVAVLERRKPDTLL